MDKSNDKSSKRFILAEDKRVQQFSDALEQENDRAIAIISACLIDNLLEGILQAFYIRDPKVKMLFKNDQMLQSLFAKINVAYFSGLIPQVIYHDLKLICEIRNKFAHEVTTDLDFDNSMISQRIGKCIMRPKTIDDIPANKFKYIIIVQQLIDALCFLEHVALEYKRPNLLESLKLDEHDWTEATLKREQIMDIMRKPIPAK